MNWIGLMDTLLNIGISFGAGWGTSVASGGTNRQALAAGLVALGANQMAQHRKPPELVK